MSSVALGTVGADIAKVSNLLQSQFGDVYNPIQHWTSVLRGRSGLPPYSGLTSYASFTLTEPAIVDKMTDFLIKFGYSETPKWQDRIRKHPHVFHLEVAATSGSKDTSFAFTTSQVEKVCRKVLYDCTFANH